MTFLHLNSGASYGLLGDRAVFLDLRRDRYLVLDEETEAIFRIVRSAEDQLTADAPARARLLATGLFREHSLRGGLNPVQVHVPVDSVLDSPNPRPRLRSLPRVWSSVSRARRRLRTVPLFNIVEHLRERRYAARAANDGEPAQAAARSFLCLRQLVPVERTCLLDSLAMLDWLEVEGGHATLVFGVRLDPFGAHCWLQTDDMLLTDAHDAVAPFAPVLTV